MIHLTVRGGNRAGGRRIGRTDAVRREHHDRRTDVADHQKDLEEGAQFDAGVVAAAADVVGVVEHWLVENERGEDGREKRRRHEPAGDTSGPSLLRRLLWQGKRHAR